MMTEKFGILPTGEEATLYTISCGKLTAAVTDCGAALVKLLVPDANGNVADVVLGCEDASGYFPGGSFLGATVARNANRVKGASFMLNGKKVELGVNDNSNNLHSGPNSTNIRLWDLVSHTADSVTFRLKSPHGDQGFPGNAVMDVTYRLEENGSLAIIYDAEADQDTVFNMTNHSYFNLAGHENTDKAMDQILTIPGRFFNPDDAENIPTGELRPVAGTPFDFRKPKAIGRDINEDYEPLHLQAGYDHNFEVFCNPCAILEDPVSGRSMAVSTDCPGIQFYAGNFLNETGKDGHAYGYRQGIALETQFYPDSVHHPEWPQPFLKAGEHYHSETEYKFSW